MSRHVVYSVIHGGAKQGINKRQHHGCRRSPGAIVKGVCDVEMFVDSEIDLSTRNGNVCDVRVFINCISI
jgi:hypothetical protein